MRYIWTRQAIECYQRGCICRGCSIRDILTSMPCRMKKTVIELVRVIGIPPSYILNGSDKFEDRIVEAILNGCTTRAKIAEYLNLSESSVQYRINCLCEVVQSLGCRFKRSRNRLPELVEFLKEYFNDTRDE